MIAPTRISIDAVHAPVYYVESVTSTLDLAASLLADTATPTPHLTTIIADVKAQDEAVSAAPGSPHPARPSSPRPSSLCPSPYTLTLSAGSSMRAHCPCATLWPRA